MSPETWVLAGGILILCILVTRPRRRRRHSRFYDWYLKSSLWKIRRWLWYWTSDRRCEKCRCRTVLHKRGVRYRLGTPVVTIHHKHYRSLGRERRRDVELLCWPCHARTDYWRHS